MQRNTNTSLVAILLLCFTLLLGACSNGTPNASGNSPTQANSSSTPSSPTNASDSSKGNVESSSTAEGQAKTKTMSTIFGDVDVPMEPKRIVSVGLEDMLLSLDAPLVQASGTKGDYLYDRLQEKKVPTLGFLSTPNYEAILATNPDLIIVIDGYVDQAGYEKLSQIAPTLAYDRGDWKTSIVQIGKAINREEKANEIIKDYDDKLSKAQQTIAQSVGTNKTVALVRLTDKEADVFFPKFPYGGVLYNDLGLKPDVTLAEFQKTAEEDWGTTLSLEKLPELKADYLFVTAGYSGSSEEDFQKTLQSVTGVESLQVWKAIPAVKQNHTYKVSARHWMLNGPIADSMKIDDVVQALTVKK